jgi:hypothetical protein
MRTELIILDLHWQQCTTGLPLVRITAGQRNFSSRKFPVQLWGLPLLIVSMHRSSCTMVKRLGP